MRNTVNTFMLQRALSTVALVLVCAFGTAQEIRFTASVDRNSIAVGDRIKLTLELSNSQAPFGHPDFGGLTMVSGPFESSNFSSVNGRMTMSVSRTYVLTATEPGDYTIKPVQVRIGGGVISTEAIKVHVVKATGSPGTSTPSAPPAGANRDLFASISLSKNKAYTGEAVVATYSLFTRYSSIELSDFELPTVSGFWAEEIDIGQANWERDLRTINGLQYRVAVLKKQLLFPQRSGDLKITPMSLTCIVNRGFFNPGTQVEVRSNEAVLKVIELPAGRPADFSGTVGEVGMQVIADRTAVKANEAIDLKVKFNGTANLKLLEAPTLELPPDMETYEPKVVDRISVNGGGMSGTREFQYLVIPRHEGEYILPPVTFSYFDPRTATYKNLRSDTLRFSISAGDGSSGGSAQLQRPTQNDVRVLDKDIRTIRVGDPGLREKGHHLFGSAPWIAGMAAPPLAFLLLLGWNRRRARELADVSGRRRKGADRVARQRLKAAAEALRSNDRHAFYEALGRAMEGYFADKFDLGVAQVNGSTIAERLGSLDNGAVAARYAAVLDRCGMARYAPVEEQPRQQLYDEAAHLIGTIENALKS